MPVSPADHDRNGGCLFWLFIIVLTGVVTWWIADKVSLAH